jgi:hypothetical protein
MTTRAGIIQRVARELGGYTGTVVSGSATTAVLGGLIGTSGDNYLLKDAALYFPGASVADQERVVTGWVDSTGAATFATRSVSNPANAEFVAFPKNTYNITTIRNAIDDCLTKTRRTWRTEVILTPEQRSYPVRLDWLRNRKDIDAVHYRNSPNLLVNEDFAKWNGTEIEGWVTPGTKTTDFAVGDFALSLERDGTDVTVEQGLPLNYLRWMLEPNGTKTLAFGMLVQATDASQARVYVDDGATQTYSSYHTGSGTLEWLTGLHTVSPSATQLSVGGVVEVDGEVVFARAITHLDAPINEMLQRNGSTAYLEQPITENARNVGGTPVVELAYPRMGQLVIYSRRAYQTPATDTELLDIPEQVLYHGTMYDLASLQRRGEDRTRLDRLTVLHGNAYNQMASDLIDVPVPMPLARLMVTGA